MTTRQQPFDITKIQHDLEQELRRQRPVDLDKQFRQMPPIEYAPPHVRDQVDDEQPYYLPTSDNVSAMAVASQYDAAAKELELMGEALKEASRRAEAMAAKVSEALRYIADTAKAYREEAALIFERIEKVDELSTAVMAACEELKQRATTLNQSKN